ncbi:MAG TPA: palindromic element RPE4 domain-containing protein [Rickettsia endosymbiont of Omalisus fontisbellaquei]|nr:palindromic element RPE4 domain-containing protein [Rickettsia endosymbiont of Omalisus fontisbellaquei]
MTSIISCFLDTAVKPRYDIRGFSLLYQWTYPIYPLTCNKLLIYRFYNMLYLVNGHGICSDR